MKKIAIMSFYESNSRYIHELSKKIKTEIGIDVVQLCMYSSSKNYCKRNALNYIYLPSAVRHHDRKTNINVNPQFYDFHSALFPTMDKDFLDISMKYWSYYENVFPWGDFERVVFIGDKRLYSSIGGYFASKEGVKAYYFEPGPYGTMIFDPKGVNCNMSVSNITLDDMRETLSSSDIKYLYDKCVSASSEKKFYEKRLGTYFRKVKDVLQSVPPKMFRRIGYVELLTGEGFWESIPYLLGRLPFYNKKNGTFNKTSARKKYIFIALQVPNDVQIISNCKHFTSIEDMLGAVITSLPDGYDLVVREHPMNKGRYSKLLYNLIDENENIYIDNETSINNLIDDSDLVIVINSTVGLEAAVRGAAVLTLGDIYYPQIVNSLSSRSELRTEIKQSIGNKKSKEDIELYIAYLFAFYMVKDNYKNEHYHDLTNAMNKICCN